jgi:predicted HTH transcriptional regulator
VDTADLEQRLEAGQETQSFEVKASMPWNVKSLAKHILAMANIRDGGMILIGVDDKTFAREGTTAAVRDTYSIDIMRDQMAQYADPHVDFSVTFPVDRDGRTYVAIHVASFRRVPVICRRDSEGTLAGAIYYRSSNRRAESAAVRNSYDMSDIVMLAALRTRQHLEDLGALSGPAPNPLTRRLDEELDGL